MTSDCQPNDIQMECRFGKLSALEWIGASCAHEGGNIVTVIALHGWLDNAASFSRVAPAIVHLLTSSAELSGHSSSEWQAQHRINQVRLIALDLPGHGMSDWLPQISGGAPDYHIWTPAQALFDVLGQLSEPVHLLGHSMGAASALLLAGAVPERLKSLVSLDVLGPVVESPSLAAEKFRQSLHRSSFQIQTSGAHKKRPRLYASCDEAVVARLKAGNMNPGMTAKCIEPVVLRNLKPVGPGWAWRTDPALRRPGPFRMTPDMLDAFLSSAKIPVQFIGAEQGLAAQLDLASRADKLPVGSQLSLPGHHHFHLEPSTCDRVACEIGAFIRHVEFS